MKTRIISAFPGTGKTTYFNSNKKTTLDSDRSEYSWKKDENGNNTKERNTNFPQNYINHIKENIGKYELIFVSSHKEVRDALKQNNIHFYLIYPTKNRKKEFIKRYRDRNSPIGFIKLLDTKYEEWIEECSLELIGCTNIKMRFKNLKDEIKYIIVSENKQKNKIKFNKNNTWEYNLIQNVRWKEDDAKDDVILFVKTFLSEITKEEKTPSNENKYTCRHYSKKNNCREYRNNKKECLNCPHFNEF